MNHIKLIVLIIFIVFSQQVFSGPPGFGDTPPEPVPQSGGGANVPIDGGISLFLLAAAGAGSWLLGKKKKV